MVRDRAILFIHLVATIARLLGPGGARSVVAESLLVKHQLVIANRARQRSPRLRPSDRIVVGICSILMHPPRLLRSVIILKPSTVLSFHRALVRRKYHRFLIAIIVEIKPRNPRFGYRRIADQISLVFNINVDK
jgi:putative transposase